MEDIQLLDAVERYIRGEMNRDEVAHFEQLRKTNADVDQLVVEHTIFLQQLHEFGDRKQFRSALQETYNHLSETGDIKPEAPRAKVVEMARKYRRVWAVAASIAGIIAITVSGLVAYFTPHSQSDLLPLVREIQVQKAKLNNLTNETRQMKGSIIPADAPMKLGGTGFLVDSKGYLVTNAHVIKDARHIIIQNNKGQEFKVVPVYTDNDRDLAILKVEDDNFKPYDNLPYGFRKSGVDLGEQIFTLGFPRDEIVYGEGYMSAKTGYNGDTLSCQIAVAANPGNSGGPVFNKNGEVIGILSARQLQAQGSVFAVTTRNIFRALDELKKDTTYQSLKVNTSSSVKGMDRVQQIKKIEDCVFVVKTY
ncbi:MAG TPA: trypsin-like peptidase domain-containing protein [Chitinophagaceae bacterium]|nr:trypsin-like peptidase domain-containing protein [Chitinophagaceae bacterium]